MIDYHVLRGVQYKSGQPVTMCVSKPKAKPVEQVRVPNEKSIASKVDTPKGKEAAKQTVAKAPQKTIPNAQIVQRGQFDIGDHLQSGKKLFRPKELVVKVELPKQVRTVE